MYRIVLWAWGQDGPSVPGMTVLLRGSGPNNTPPHFWPVLRCSPLPAGLLPAGTGDIPLCIPGCPSARTETPG